MSCSVEASASFAPPPSIALARMAWRLANWVTYQATSGDLHGLDLPAGREETSAHPVLYAASRAYYEIIDRISHGEPGVEWVTDTGPNP